MMRKKNIPLIILMAWFTVGFPAKSAEKTECQNDPDSIIRCYIEAAPQTKIQLGWYERFSDFLHPEFCLGRTFMECCDVVLDVKFNPCEISTASAMCEVTFLRIGIEYRGFIFQTSEHEFPQFYTTKYYLSLEKGKWIIVRSETHDPHDVFDPEKGYECDPPFIKLDTAMRWDKKRLKELEEEKRRGLPDKYKGTDDSREEWIKRYREAIETMEKLKKEYRKNPEKFWRKS